MLQIAGKSFFQCKLSYLVKATLQSDLIMKNVFRTRKTNNKNYLVKTIRLKLHYVIYGFITIFIDNLICVANVPTPDLIRYHLEQDLNASYNRCWSTGITERKLPMQYTISLEVYVEEGWKLSLHIIPLTSGSVAYSSYHSISFLKWL